MVFGVQIRTRPDLVRKNGALRARPMLKVPIFAKKAKRFPVVISQFTNEDGGNVNRISKHAHEPDQKIRSDNTRPPNLEEQ